VGFRFVMRARDTEPRAFPAAFFLLAARRPADTGRRFLAAGFAFRGALFRARVFLVGVLFTWS
jgi:hypothetical protein